MTGTAALVPGISVAELDMMRAAASAFLASQGTATRDSYHWPPDSGHYLDPRADEPGGPPAAMAAGVLEVMRRSAAESLASQGTGHRDICDWPDPHDQHGHMIVTTSDAFRSA